ncbi:hypothetical protein PUN28_006738 [Cardiocondyla obscurior]|uniref:Uncharacterized protein n=1 Tax=Cardiocondyla obscurior TaxID=286306 RepID=A0AAW2FZI2_9HYME
MTITVDVRDLRSAKSGDYLNDPRIPLTMHPLGEKKRMSSLTRKRRRIFRHRWQTLK